MEHLSCRHRCEMLNRKAERIVRFAFAMMMFFRLPVSMPAFAMMMFFPFARFIDGSRFLPPVPPQHPSLWCSQLSCYSQSATKKYKQFKYKQKHKLLETRYGCPIIEAARNTTMTNPMALTSMLLIIYRTDNDCLFTQSSLRHPQGALGWLH